MGGERQRRNPVFPPEYPQLVPGGATSFGKNPRPIIDPARRGGLTRDHPFVQALFGEVLKRLRPLVAEERRRGSDVLYLHAGDLLFPSLMSRHFQGRQMIEAMNQAGLDMATFGNHEFDDPDPKVLLSRISESRFSWVSSNVLDARTGKPFGGVRPYLLREVGSARVGIFGLTLAERSQAYVRYLDPLVAAEKTIQALRREGVSFLIALTQLSMEEDRALARRYPEIGLIAGGQCLVAHRRSTGAIRIRNRAAPRRSPRVGRRGRP